MERKICNGKYVLQRKIGSGSFGEIHLGLHVSTNKKVAIKLEKRRSRHQQLLYEAKLYKYLKTTDGLPNVYWYGTEAENNILIMELLGSSLEDLMTKNRKPFSLKSVLMLADQMISRIELLHRNNFLHRDIKPDNFMMGRGQKASEVFIIDFGLAKRFKDARTHLHIPYREGKSLTGTARYASINTHLGVEQSRRDDLESLAHVLIYFLKGSLPWQGLRALNNQEKYKKIKQKKVSISPTSLCNGLPDAF